MTTGELLDQSSSVSNVSALEHLQNLNAGGTEKLVYVRSFTADKVENSTAISVTKNPTATTSGITTATTSTNSAEFIAPKYTANKERNKC